MLSSVFHISEEIPDAKRKGPQILNATVIVGGITGMFCLLSLLFCLSDIEAGLETAYGLVGREFDLRAQMLTGLRCGRLPFAQICMDATGSKAATTVFLIIPTLLLCYGSRGCQLTASRIMLSLGRDSGLPWSRSFTKIRSGEPYIGLIVSSVVPLLAGLVQIGATSAFNSLLGTAVILLQASYGKSLYESSTGTDSGKVLI
jgi:choline transport protein